MSRRSLTQRILLSRVGPDTARRIGAESRRWRMICVECGRSTPYWEAGGIRYRARGRDRPVRGRCPRCAAFRRFRVEYAAA